MKHLSALKQLALLTAAAVTLGACSFKTIDTGTFVRVPETRALIAVNDPAYEGITPERVGFADSRELEEYALYRGDGGQAEVLYVETRPARSYNLALEFKELVAATIRKWRFNKGHQLTFGDTVAIKNNIGQFWMQPFQQTDTNRKCVGFQGTWDTRFNDPDLRPSKLMFGYHCSPANTELADDGARLVRSLQVRGISVPLKIKSAYDLKEGDPAAPPRETQVANLVMAQDGAGGGVAGIPDFPLLIVRAYRDIDGRCASNC